MDHPQSSWYMRGCQQTRSSHWEVFKHITCKTIQFHCTISPGYAPSVSSFVQTWSRESRSTPYTDASFSNRYNSSHPGKIVLPADKHDTFCVLHFASNNRGRIARSVLGAETSAFVGAFDFAYFAEMDLQKLLDRLVSLSTLTDSKSLFHVITKCSKHKRDARWLT